MKSGTLHCGDIKGKKVISNSAMQSILDERLSNLASEAAWYLYRSMETKYLVSFYYRYRYEMVMKRYYPLLRARDFFR